MIFILQDIHGCSAGLTVIFFFGMDCSAAEKIACVICFTFSSISLFKFRFSTRLCSDSSVRYRSYSAKL